MHCLSTLHNIEKEFAKKSAEGFGLKSREVSNEAFNSQHSVVFFTNTESFAYLKSIDSRIYWQKL
jgi:hypothetical protein